MPPARDRRFFTAHRTLGNGRGAEKESASLRMYFPEGGKEDKQEVCVILTP